MDSLRPYQIDGIERGKTSLDNNGFYLGDEMGIGKSAQALELVKSYSVLVVCPKNAVGVWEAEFRKWKGATHVHKFLGSPGVRYQGWVAYRDCPEVFKALITTYSLLGKLLDEARSPIFGTVIFDEIHHIRNRKTRSYDSAKHLRAGRKIGLSGSPIVNRPDDLWAPLSVLFPNEYRSYWNWVGEHLVKIQGDFGVEVGGMKAPEAFRESISAQFLRRTKTQVEIDLPPKQRVEIPLELEGAQLKLYRDMANRMVAELPSGELLTTPSHLGKITRLRQILVSPALVGSDAPSALLEALGEWTGALFADHHKVVIFTPFVEAFPLIRSTLAKPSEWIHGKMTADQVSAAVKNFQEAPWEKVSSIVVSIRGAQSFTLTAASHAFFVGYDWTPAYNKQAEDRLHRIGQNNPVTAYYFVHKGTFDIHQMKILDGKTTWSAQAIDPYKLVFPSFDSS